MPRRYCSLPLRRPLAVAALVAAILAIDAVAPQPGMPTQGRLFGQQNQDNKNRALLQNALLSVRVQRDKPSELVDATAFLLEVNGKPFLITSGSVLTSGKPLQFKGVANTPVTLEYASVFLSTEQDVGMIVLPDAGIPGLTPLKAPDDYTNRWHPDDEAVVPLIASNGAAVSTAMESCANLKGDGACSMSLYASAFQGVAPVLSRKTQKFVGLMCVRAGAYARPSFVPFEALTGWEEASVVDLAADQEIISAADARTAALAAFVGSPSSEQLAKNPELASLCEDLLFRNQREVAPWERSNAELARKNAAKMMADFAEDLTSAFTNDLTKLEGLRLPYSQRRLERIKAERVELVERLTKSGALNLDTIRRWLGKGM